MSPKEQRYVENSIVKSSEDPGDEIVISGIAGRFPGSDNVIELRDNLMKKVDLIADTDHRWDLGNAEIPERIGQINNPEKFDAVFFGVSVKQSNTMDPMYRMILEHAYEAIVDAGINPKHLRGTKTGVFFGVCFSETEKTFIYEKLEVNGSGLTGSCRAMMANRTSYWLGVHGPSYIIDSTCTSSFSALENAYRAIKNGQCDSALIGAANLCLHPYISLQFFRLGALSPDGRCKSFDASADGYARSDTISVAYLQKSKDAKRVYATISHVRTHWNGVNAEGINYPSSLMQSALLKKFYDDCKIQPSSISYIEAHGSGSKYSDLEEINAIDAVFCHNRKDPLKIGSVKSNMGHTEAASGMAQITKVILANEYGFIPPNLHYNKPLRGMKALEEGRIQVVTEPTSWNGGYIAINSFGFGGCIGHVVLKSNPKEKVNNAAPKDDLPRLVVTSGRTSEAVDVILSDLESKPIDVEFIRLLHDVHADDIPGHLYRGYTIVGTSPEKKLREIEEYPGAKRPIWFIFSGMGSQWPTMGAALLRFPIFANAIGKCDAVLKPHGVDIYNILTNPEKSAFDVILNSFVGIAAVQIGLVDLLTALGIVPDGIIGHSVGELGCSYADGCFTAEQMILAAYYRGLASMEVETIRGSMAAVALGYNDVKDLCPPDIEVACHNSASSSTISGPAESMQTFVAQLTEKKIFAREVPTSNIAYHSRYIAELGPRLLASLKKIIPDPKLRSAKWHSTSVPHSQWDTPLAKYSSAEYHTNNLLSSVLFEETSTFIPKNAITIEIAPHGLLQAILNRSLGSGVTNVPLTQRGHKDNVEVFLQGIGKLYKVGLQPTVSKLYPDVQFPVSRGTPMIPPLIRWEHSDDWYVPRYKLPENITSGERSIELSLSDENYAYMEGHIIQDKNILPLSGILMLLWETLATIKQEKPTDLPVVFENIRFSKTTVVCKEAPTNINLIITRGTGSFEVVVGGEAVLSGSICHPVNIQEEQIKFKLPAENEVEEMNVEDVYKELKLRDYQYTGQFRTIKSATTSGSKGTICWANNWAIFIDGMIQMAMLSLDTRNTLLPVYIRKLTIDPKKHLQPTHDMLNNQKDFKVYVSTKQNAVVSGGIQICGMKLYPISEGRSLSKPVSELHGFVAHKDRAEISLKEAVYLATHLSIENNLSTNVKILESLEAGEKYSSQELFACLVGEVLKDSPKIQADINIVTTQNTFKDEELAENVSVVEPNKLNSKTCALILAGRNLLTPKRSGVLSHLFLTLKDDAFIITLETSSHGDITLVLAKYGLEIILEKTVNNSTFLLLRKTKKLVNKYITIQVNSEEFTWVKKLKAALKAQTEDKSSNSSRILLVSHETSDGGLLGLVNCLRKEPSGEIIRSVLIQDSKAPDFALSKPLYADQLKLDLVVNVLRPQGIWGSYRQQRLPIPELRSVHHVWANQLVKGDLASFQWTEGPIGPSSEHTERVNVIYSSINTRDVMIATGQVKVDMLGKSRKEEEFVFGSEYSGVTSDGRRVMGLLNDYTLTNYLTSDPTFTWTIPDKWTFEDAVTVPFAYTICYYAFDTIGGISKEHKLLIHDGSSGIGQAAINLASRVGCEIFTTVDTDEKKSFIRQHFPQIPDSHINNSRDTSFEQLIVEQTNGKGIDIVLNLLPGNKLEASLKCLAFRGRFLHVEMCDSIHDSTFGMSIFLKEVSFHGIMPHRLFREPVERRMELNKIVQKGLDEGAVIPLSRTVFPKKQIDIAFRYITTGNYTGKVVLEIQTKDKVNTLTPAIPRYHCLKERSYLIIEGLDGFGLELADWLVLRGAQNLILASHRNAVTGYQSMRVKLWKSYGVNVTVISGKEASNIKDCEDILTIASKQAPIDAIYNLSVIRQENLFEDQTPETFKESVREKVWSTRNLDKLSQKLCPSLRHFVVFSSISRRCGNIGQTPEGLCTSIVERICERRCADGLPALAIRWGPIADIYSTLDIEDECKKSVIRGTVRQKVASCLCELDNFLNQSSPIVSSTIIAEKRDNSKFNMVDIVLNIAGLKTFNSTNQRTPFVDLGISPLKVAEIRQVLAYDFDLPLTGQEIRTLNYLKLLSLKPKTLEEANKTNLNNGHETLTGMKLFVRSLKTLNLPADVCFKLATQQRSKRHEIFLIPGVDGSAAVFENIASRIKAPATCLQLTNINTKHLTIQQMADTLLPHVVQRSEGRKDFLLVGYSLGALIAIELTRQLEVQGFVGKLILIDGTPDFLKAATNNYLRSNNDDEFQANILTGLANIISPNLSVELFGKLKQHETWEKKLDEFTKHLPDNITELLPEQKRDIYTCIYKRLDALNSYDISTLPLLRTPITLLKSSAQALKEISADYGLSKVTEEKVIVHTVDGNHLTILDNPKTALAINGETLQDAEDYKHNLVHGSKSVIPLILIKRTY